MTRYVLFPIEDKESWKMYKQHVASFWTPEEIDLAEDTRDWYKLNQSEQHFIKMILAFFAGADGVVNENLVVNFYQDFEAAEVKAFYSFQIAMETIHSETYSLLIEKLVEDKMEQSRLFNAISQIETIKRKNSWAFEHMKNEYPLNQRLLAYTFVEGLFFSGSFCAIFWLKKRGLMPGLCFSNELISRDEGLHAEFSILMYRRGEKINEEKVVRLVKEAVEIETQFITQCLPCSLVGMNVDMMISYIKYVADFLLLKLGHDTIYNVSNPFDWMELISLQGKTNFFEKRVGEYQKKGVLNGSENTFETDLDF